VFRWALAPHVETGLAKMSGFKPKPYGTISKGSMTERNPKYIEDLRLRKPHVSLGRGRP